MTRTEHLLTIVAEECAEIAQSATKAMRFGLSEVKPGQDRTNAQRLSDEYADLCAVMIMLRREFPELPGVDKEQLEAKRVKVETFLDYSRDVCRTLTREGKSE